MRTIEMLVNHWQRANDLQASRLVSQHPKGAITLVNM